MTNDDRSTPGVDVEEWQHFLRTAVKCIKGAADPRAVIAARNDPYGDAAYFAHLDVCRTFHGAKYYPDLKRRGRLMVSKTLKYVAENPLRSHSEFDRLHRHKSKLLMRELRKCAPGVDIYVGQAQKWINMALKYGLAFGEDLIPGLSASWHYMHIPIDDYMKTAIANRPELKSAYIFLHAALDGRPWSRISNYDKYLAFQVELRQIFLPRAPLDFEYKAWEDERIRRRNRGNEKARRRNRDDVAAEPANPPSFDHERLVKILGMMGSAHLGERANAAAAAHKLITEAGLRWPDVIKGASELALT